MPINPDTLYDHERTKTTCNMLRICNWDLLSQYTKKVMSTAPTLEIELSILDAALEASLSSGKEDKESCKFFTDRVSIWLLNKVVAKENCSDEYPSIWEYLTSCWTHSINTYYLGYGYRDDDIKRALLYFLRDANLSTATHAISWEDQTAWQIVSFADSIFEWCVDWATQDVTLAIIDKVYENRHTMIDGSGYIARRKDLSNTWTTALKESARIIADPDIDSTLSNRHIERIALLGMFTNSIMDDIKFDSTNILYKHIEMPWMISHGLDPKVQDLMYNRIFQMIRETSHGDNITMLLGQFGSLLTKLSEPQADEIVKLVRSGFRNSWVGIITSTPLLEVISEDFLRKLIKRSKHKELFGAISRRTNIPKDIQDAIEIHQAISEFR